MRTHLGGGLGDCGGTIAKRVIDWSCAHKKLMAPLGLAAENGDGWLSEAGPKPAIEAHPEAVRVSQVTTPNVTNNIYKSRRHFACYHSPSLPPCRPKYTLLSLSIYTGLSCRTGLQ